MPALYTFESSVNSEGIETFCYQKEFLDLFESSVNSEGIETILFNPYQIKSFESSVNSEGIETLQEEPKPGLGLRAVRCYNIVVTGMANKI